MHSKIEAFAGVEDNIAEAIQAYMAKKYPKLGQAKMKRRKLKARDEVAGDAGYRAGKSAQLHRAVGHKPTARLTSGV
ncbi:hypothetical protein D3C75_1277870 [compost metagenome]